MTTRIAVALEITPKKTFATAVDWPGWSRAGKTEADALAALVSYADRYALVAATAGESLPTDDLQFDLAESGPGNATTEFGAPGRIADADRRSTTSAEADRLTRLVAAAWAAFDAAAATAPAELRKGPRGGGRDTAKIVEHALMADHAYAREIGLRPPGPSASDPKSVAALRDAMLAVLRTPSDGNPLAGRKWPARYAATRIAWHALDHAWEIEDRSEPGSG
jgi:hypothetical protein